MILMRIKLVCIYNRHQGEKKHVSEFFPCIELNLRGVDCDSGSIIYSHLVGLKYLVLLSGFYFITVFIGFLDGVT